MGNFCREPPKKRMVAFLSGSLFRTTKKRGSPQKKKRHPLLGVPFLLLSFLVSPSFCRSGSGLPVWLVYVTSSKLPVDVFFSGSFKEP